MDPNTTCVYGAFSAVHQTPDALQWQFSGSEKPSGLAPTLGLACVLAGLEFIVEYFQGGEFMQSALREISRTTLRGINNGEIVVASCELVMVKAKEEPTPVAQEEVFGDLSSQVRLIVPHSWIDDALSVGDATLSVEALARLMATASLAEYMVHSDTYETNLGRQMLSQSIDITVALPQSMHRRANNLARAILAAARGDEQKDAERMAS